MTQTTAGRTATVRAVVDYEPARLVPDGTVTTGSTTVTAPSAAFTAADVGQRISGTGIPGSTRITAVTNASTVTISTAATASASPTRLVIETPRVAVNSWRRE